MSRGSQGTACGVVSYGRRERAQVKADWQAKVVGGTYVVEACSRCGGFHVRRQSKP